MTIRGVLTLNDYCDSWGSGEAYLRFWLWSFHICRKAPSLETGDNSSLKNLRFCRTIGSTLDTSILKDFLGRDYSSGLSDFLRGKLILLPLFVSNSSDSTEVTRASVSLELSSLATSWLKVIIFLFLRIEPGVVRPIELIELNCKWILVSDFLRLGERGYLRLGELGYRREFLELPSYK